MLQLAAEKRVAIEAAMRTGIAVVAFNCHDVSVVESCQLEGSYDFTGLPRTDVDRRFTSREQTHAASPLWGKSTPPLAIEPGEVLTLKLATVGQRRATVSRAAKRDLEGDCARATHFVQVVHVGAFVLTATRGSGTNEAKSGDLRACPAASSGARAPEPQCSAALQLELVPIGP